MPVPVEDAVALGGGRRPGSRDDASDGAAEEYEPHDQSDDPDAGLVVAEGVATDHDDDEPDDREEDGGCDEHRFGLHRGVLEAHERLARGACFRSLGR